MFEAMMKRFQEDTVRYLYLMQVLERPEESGTAALSGGGGTVDRASDAGTPIVKSGSGGGKPRPRSVSTTLDEMEQEFQRKKRRELGQARMAGAGETQQVQTVRRSSEKIGRNDPCPCGSGKTYKKCNGTAP